MSLTSRLLRTAETGATIALIVHLAFSTPMVAFREPMLGLFDAIVSALRWVHESDKRSP